MTTRSSLDGEGAMLPPAPRDGVMASRQSSNVPVVHNTHPLRSWKEPQPTKTATMATAF